MNITQLQEMKQAIIDMEQSTLRVRDLSDQLLQYEELKRRTLTDIAREKSVLEQLQERLLGHLVEKRGKPMEIDEEEVKRLGKRVRISKTPAKVDAKAKAQTEAKAPADAKAKTDEKDCIVLDENEGKCQWLLNRKPTRVCGNDLCRVGDYCLAHSNSQGVINPPTNPIKSNGDKSLRASVYDFMLKIATKQPQKYGYFVSAMLNDEEFKRETKFRNKETLMATLFNTFTRRELRDVGKGELMAKRDELTGDVVFWKS